MSTNPYFLDGPALLSFSGGRTSGFMLKRTLDAHGGTLPEYARVCFANTGKERPETLEFVAEIERRWNVPITWLEYDPQSWRDGNGCYRVVDFATASRAGEPFERAIHDRHDRPNSPSYLPNGVQRICTHYLKVAPFRDFMKHEGYGCAETGDWANVIGLRADESRRLATLRARNAKGEDNRMPLATAGITKHDVMDFWKSQSFDLNLEPWEGNCDLCFLKGKRLRVRMLINNPEIALWWIEQETRVGARFDKTASVTDLAVNARFLASLPVLPGILDDVEDDEAETGRVSCLCTD